MKEKVRKMRSTNNNKLEHGPSNTWWGRRRSNCIGSKRMDMNVVNITDMNITFMVTKKTSSLEIQMKIEY